MKVCNAEDCLKEAYAKGYCTKHYARIRRHNDLRTLPEMRPQNCKVDGCSRPKRSNGYCHMHSERLRKTGKIGPAEIMKDPTTKLAVFGKFPEEGMVAIYYLREPGGSPFYVGSTKSPRDRLSDHKSKFGEVEMVILRCCEAEESVYWEARLLVEMVDAGFKLANLCVPVPNNKRG